MSQTLATLRKNIDDIDTAIIDLLAKRFEYSKKIATHKKDHNKNITDLQREAMMRASYDQEAAKKNLSSPFVQTLFDQIIKESKNIQNSL